LSQSNVDPGTVDSQIGKDQAVPASHIANGVPVFKRVEDYTTFVAEYALKDNDIVVHFYPGENNKVWAIFASHMDKVAQEHFSAMPPRLVAAFTEEMNSWWLRARGFGHLLDLDAFMTKFFDALDASIEESFSV
jgi:hypothetical protein